MTALSDDELDRYARHIVLREVGGAGQVRLKRAHVVVVGAGGIGCPALLYLAAAGVGRLTVIDDDVVDVSNLQRQILFGDADIGRIKVAAATAALAKVNPHVATNGIAERLIAQNAASLMSGADIVLDGCDNFATRLIVSDTATRLRIPLVSAAIGQFQAQIGTFRGWEADKPCYRCFVGDAFDAEDCDTCAEQGVLGAMAGLVGSWAAMEVVRALTGFGPDPTGLVHIFDGVTPALRSIRIVKDSACRGCNEPA